MSLFKGMVSKNKKRHIEAGFDLDLSYITPKIIAMGFPAEKLEGIYRNHIDDVARFLNYKHGQDFRVYNLCSERCYNEVKFDRRVDKFPFDDHNPPPFKMMYEFCKNVHTYLSEKIENTAAIHCKAGKGRTGVMICCYLIFSNILPDAKSAMTFYAKARTHDCKGVTIPSQIRYIKYFESYLKRCKQLDISPEESYHPNINFIKYIFLNSKPTNMMNLTISFKIFNNCGACIFKSSWMNFKRKDAMILFDVQKLVIAFFGDVKFEFYTKDKLGRSNFLMKFWLNTYFFDAAIVESAKSNLMEFFSTDGIVEVATITSSNFQCLNNSSQYSVNEEIIGTDVSISTLNSNLILDEKCINDYWVCLKKKKIDKINKDYNNKVFFPEFQIFLAFEMINKNIQENRISEVVSIRESKKDETSLSPNNDKEAQTEVEEYIIENDPQVSYEQNSSGANNANIECFAGTIRSQVGKFSRVNNKSKSLELRKNSTKIDSIENSDNIRQHHPLIGVNDPHDPIMNRNNLNFEKNNF